MAVPPSISEHRRCCRTVLRALTVLGMTGLTIGLSSSMPAQGTTPTLRSETDSGTILISLLERPVGRERYQLARQRAELALEAQVRVVDRGTPLAIDASLALDESFRATRFRTRGKSYRFVTVGAEVALRGDSALVRAHGDTAVASSVRDAFPVEGWPPMSARALLVRSWERRGRPSRMRLLPGDSSHVARIAARGIDTVQVDGRPVLLRRFVVEGVVWGRETLWLDDRDRFAALVTRVHILPLEGVRSDLASALPQLLASAATDRMDDLARMARSAAPIAAGDYALTGVRLIDGTGRAPIDDAVMVVRGGSIAAAGARGNVTIPHGVRIVDGRGATAIPGLWDMHAHASQIEWGPAYRAAGVTTIRDMGGEERFLTALRGTLASPGAAGPRVLLAGLVDGDDSVAFGARTAATPAQGRAAVDHYHAAGFSQMKLYSELQPDVVRAIVERAHALGMTVTGHVPRALGILGAIDAGMDQVAHMPVSGDTAAPAVRDVIARLAAQKVVVDPTVPWNELLGRSRDTPIESFEPGIAHAPPALAASYRSASSNATATAVHEGQARQLALIRTMHNAGVPLVAGTDGAVPGHSLLRSIELFVRAGLTPMEAIQSATVVPARAMGEGSLRGTLEVGKRADFVVLDANPLDDISNIRRTRWVARDGVLLASDALWSLAGFRD